VARETLAPEATTDAKPTDPETPASAAPAPLQSVAEPTSPTANKLDSSCKSIQAGVTDFWCQHTCGTGLSCPELVCECGAKELEKPPTTEAIASTDDTANELAPSGSEASTGSSVNITFCKSVQAGVDDLWCQRTCLRRELKVFASAFSACPADICTCESPLQKKDLEEKGEAEQTGGAQVTEPTLTNEEEAAPASTAPTSSAASTAPVPVPEDASLDSTCKSIQGGVDDMWCMKTCGTGTFCPEKLCLCGTDAQKAEAAKAEDKANEQCDFDRVGCLSTGESTADDCRTCGLHINTCATSAHFDDEHRIKEMSLDDCIDMVAGKAKECAACRSPENKQAFQDRVGRPDPERLDRWHRAVAGDQSRQAEAAADTVPDESPDLSPPRLRTKEDGDGSLDYSCVSVQLGIDNFYCAKICAAGSCPETMCKCGADASKLATQADASEATSGPTCRSLQAGVDDLWCTKTCATGLCPDQLCRCGADAEALAKLESDADEAKAKQECDFDRTVCISTSDTTAPACRTCGLHVNTCLSSPHFGEGQQYKKMTVEECIDEVADQAIECRSCQAAEHKAAYRARLGPQP
jgi:hypothetical protein